MYDCEAGMGDKKSYRCRHSTGDAVMLDTDSKLGHLGKLTFAVIALRDAMSLRWGCDNVGGPPREDCQCQTCEADRHINDLEAMMRMRAQP